MIESTTSLRLTDDDRAWLNRLRTLIGADSFAAAIRFAVREAVRARDPSFEPKPRRSRASQK